jgi:4-amino-4-deoxy-L-arabinose transferase-like glycosyltransferase
MSKKRKKKKNDKPQNGAFPNKTILSRQWIIIGILVLIVMLGFWLRFRLWNEMKDDPVHKDALLYCTMAKNIAKFGVFSSKTTDNIKEAIQNPSTYTMPGYSIFLAGIYCVFGADPFPLSEIRFIQVLLSLWLIVLGYLFGRFLHSDIAGLICALIVALYPSNIFVTQLVLTEGLFAIFFVTTVFYFLKSLTRNWDKYRLKLIEGAIASVSFTIAFSIRPTLLPFLPLIFLWLVYDYYINRPRIKRLLIFLVVIGGPLFLFWGGWTLRNAIQFKHFIPLTTSSNNPKLLGIDFKRKYTPKMFQISGSEYEVNKKWGEWASAAFKENMQKHRKAFLRHLRFKIIPFLAIPFGATPAQGWERMSASVEYWFYRVHRLFLWLAAISFVILLPRRKEIWLVFLLCILFLLTHLVYLTNSRYGYPLFALLIIFSGVCIAEFFFGILKVWKNGGWQKYPGILSPLIAIILLIYRCSYLSPFYSKYFLIGTTLGVGIILFWIFYIFKEKFTWYSRASILTALFLFSINFWAGAGNYRVWGITPERAFSYGYLYTDKDVIEQIIDLPENIKDGEKYSIFLKTLRGSSVKPTYDFKIFLNGKLFKTITPEEKIQEKMYIDIPTEIIQKDFLKISLKLDGKVDVYKQYILVHLRLDKFKGISVFNGQMKDLSYRKYEQKGTFEIALIKHKGDKKIYWRGSTRKQVLKKLKLRTGSKN